MKESEGYALRPRTDRNGRDDAPWGDEVKVFPTSGEAARNRSYNTQ